MKSKIKTGTGLSYHSIDYDAKKVEVDLSGDYDGTCFRNDASIFFFAANSYMHAFYMLGKSLDERFANNANRREIEYLVLPYFFNFRHYVELELKGFIVALKKEPPRISHDLLELHATAYKAVQDSVVEEDNIFSKDFDSFRQDAIDSMDRIGTWLQDFNELEPSPDYYRYIFGKGKSSLPMENTVISLDFSKIKKLFIEVMNEFNNVFKSLKSGGIYVYQI